MCNVSPVGLFSPLREARFSVSPRILADRLAENTNEKMKLKEIKEKKYLSPYIKPFQTLNLHNVVRKS